MPLVSSVRGSFGPLKKSQIAGDPELRFRITGGNTITVAGGYRIHTFTSTGNSSFVTTQLQASIPVEVLLVAGGGGSYGQSGNQVGTGGAGAGGLVYAPSLASPATTYPTTVGIGGPNQQNGGSSTIFGFTANGGGRGGFWPSPAASGGSGGGGTWDAGNSAGAAGNQGSFPGATGFGNPGAPSQPVDPRIGGGGGGAGGSGQGGGSSGGSGGSGRSYSISGSSLAYAGGGGGGVSNAGLSPPGGSGVGGNGQNTQSSQQGVDNRGGGAGGGSSPNAGARGGHGVIVVRYIV